MTPMSALHSRSAWRTTVSNTGSSSNERSSDELEHLARGLPLLQRVREPPAELHGVERLGLVGLWYHGTPYGAGVTACARGVRRRR